MHGRNKPARDALFTFLRAIELHPLEWAEVTQATGKPTPYIGEILDAAFSQAHAVIVLFTPDDVARLSEPLWNENEPSHETDFLGQARPNVLFEAGMAMGRDSDRTILVELGQLRPFSDISGLHLVRLSDSIGKPTGIGATLGDCWLPVEPERGKIGIERVTFKLQLNRWNEYRQNLQRQWS